MDSFTHLVLGSVVGEGQDTQRIGRKTMIVGAFAQFFPDFDILGSLWLPVSENLIFHRGITHSLIAAMVFPFLLAFISVKIFRDSSVSLLWWAKFFFFQILIHLFIDTFNAYGAGLFEPFSSEKVAFHTLYVADPLFTLPLVMAFIALLFARTRTTRLRIVIAGLTVSLLYLGITILNRFTVLSKVTARLEENGIMYDRLLVTPVAFNSMLWFVAAETQEGYHIGHCSVFDTDNKEGFVFKSYGKELVPRVEDQEAFRNLIEFSQGFYTLETWGDTLVFNDLRFGQMAGWENPGARFTFHYYLNYPDENTLVMQRGRFSKWNRKTISALFRRIAGNG